MAQAKRVVIYGDSIMKGTVIDGNLRYHATVDKYLARLGERFSFAADNRARFGMTATRGLAALEKDAARGLEAEYAVVEFGGNDSNFDWAAVSAEPGRDHLPFTPIKDFVSALKRMTGILRSLGATPILMTLPPVDAEKYLSYITRNGLERERILSWLGDAGQIFRFQRSYSEAVAELASSTGCALVDARAAFPSSGELDRFVCLDGIHPSEAGYELIAGAFARFAAAL